MTNPELSEKDFCEEEWDEETRKDWDEKMSEPVSWKKISSEELEQLRKEGKIN